MKWIDANKSIPPLNVRVECLWRYVPCKYYIKIGVAKESDAKTFTGVCYRTANKNINKGWKWTCDGVGDPSSRVEFWKPIDQQLKLSL